MCSVSDLTSKGKIEKALNQLLSFVVGHEAAKRTDELKANPTERINKCTQMVLSEYAEASSLINDCVPDARRMLAQAQHKLESLNSLTVLSIEISKADWND